MAKPSSKEKKPQEGDHPSKNVRKSTKIPSKNVSKKAKFPSENVRSRKVKRKNHHPRQEKKGKIRQFFASLGSRISQIRSNYYHPHRSFHRSYREDYLRETKVPGILEQIMATFRMIFGHFRTFLPFILLMTAGYIILVGLMSEEFYQGYQETIDEASAAEGAAKIGVFAKAALLLSSTLTTGGLDSGTDDVGQIFMLILFLTMWLVTIYLVRHFLAGHKPKLRDGLYNALTPLISTLVVLIVVFIQAIPLMLVLITYSAAVATGFLSTPFYALIYFIFALLMIIISAYCFSSSLIALAAVTAPGVYPMTALASASDLMMGRRLHFITRLVALVITVAFIFIIVMMPVILLDLWLKSFISWIGGIPIVPFALLITTCFVFIYVATYIYQYYRFLLDYQEK